MGNAVGDAPILEMISRGVRVGLGGTDGCSCGMFESLKAADLLLKHKEADPPGRLDRGATHGLS